MRRDEQGKLQLVDASDNLDKPCYDYKGLSRSRVFLERLTEALQRWISRSIKSTTKTPTASSRSITPTATP
jgi:hypothetical protein